MSAVSPSSPRVWLVTGVSSGFGREIAREALRRGDRVVGTLRRREDRAAFEAEAPGRALGVLLDLTEQVAIPGVVRSVHEAFGPVDVLVNNAGYGLVGALEEVGDEQIDRCLRTNFLGPVHLLRAVLPTMRERRAGRIINVTAIAGFANEPGFSIYGGAKAAMDALSDALALEVSPLGIHVTAVLPGPFRTDFIGRSLDRGAERIADYERTSGAFAGLLERISGRQPGDPARAAAAIYEITTLPKPPRRLFLGAYAYAKVQKRTEELRSEAEAWRSVGLPTDFPSPGRSST